MTLNTIHSRRTFLSQIGGVAAGAAALPLFGDERLPPVPSIAERLRQQVSDAPLALRLKEMTADECRMFQSQFGARLKELLGDYQPPKSWKTTQLSSISGEGYRRDELLLEAPGLPPLP